MRSREGIGSGKSSSGTTTNKTSSSSQVGKVFAIVLDENTPSPEIFKDSGGWDGIGTVYYLDYDLGKSIENPDIKSCRIAKPLNSNLKHYPLIGEVIFLHDLPSNQGGNVVSQKYYSSIVSIWNNNHHNAQTLTNAFVLGKTFKENSLIGTLKVSEGDIIYEGRFGNTIRFGSSTSLGKNIDGNPLITIVNNHNFDDNKSHYVERINEDGSSIYLTSSQAIDLVNDFPTLNSFTNTIAIKEYIKNQILFNSDRIVLNAKTDELLMFAKTNIEFYTKQTISLNADERVHLNSSLVFLGQNGAKLPSEPVLLGNKTVRVLNSIIQELGIFSSSLKSSVSTPAGSPLVDINIAATQLTLKLKLILKDLINLPSNSVFVS